MRGCGEREPFALASGLLFGDSITQVTAAQPRVQSVDPGLASSRCLGLRPRPRTTGLVSWPIPVSRFPRLSRGCGAASPHSPPPQGQSSPSPAAWAPSWHRTGGSFLGMGSDGPGRRRGLAVLDPGLLESWGARLTDETVCGHLKGLVRAAPWGHRARGGCPFLSESFFMEISASPSTLSPVVLSSCSVTLVLFPERDFFFF